MGRCRMLWWGCLRRFLLVVDACGGSDVSCIALSFLFFPLLCFLLFLSLARGSVAVATSIVFVPYLRDIDIERAGYAMQCIF